MAVLLGDFLNNPRYSTNIVISEKPDEKGQRVFFVDTGQNMDERTNKVAKFTYREVGGRIQELNLKRWAKRLEEILEKEKGKKTTP